MPWYWTDHLAGLLNSQRPTDIPQTAAWTNRPIGVRVDANANPLMIAERLMDEGEADDDPPLLGQAA